MFCPDEIVIQALCFQSCHCESLLRVTREFIPPFGGTRAFPRHRRRESLQKCLEPIHVNERQLIGSRLGFWNLKPNPARLWNYSSVAMRTFGNAHFKSAKSRTSSRLHSEPSFQSYFDLSHLICVQTSQLFEKFGGWDRQHALQIKRAGLKTWHL